MAGIQSNRRSNYLRDLGETVLEQLRILHSTYDDTGLIRDIMTGLFGQPEQCLVCAAPLGWEKQPPNDVDPWFCSQHCPICLSDDELEIYPDYSDLLA